MSTGEKVSEADALVKRIRHEASFYDPKTREVLDHAAAFIERLRSSSEDAKGRWVPWRAGDALPNDCGARWYRIARMIGAKLVTEDLFPLVFERHGVIAYWSIPLPPPYSAMSQEAP